MVFMLSDEMIEINGYEALTRELPLRGQVFSNRSLIVGVATPLVRVGDISFNEETVLTIVTEAIDADIDILLFSELALTGATCGDLFRQQALLEAVDQSLERIVPATANASIILLLSVPQERDGEIVKLTVMIERGVIREITAAPLTSSYKHFYADGVSDLVPPDWFTEDGISLPINLSDITQPQKVDCYSFPLTFDFKFHEVGVADESYGITFDIFPDARHEWTGDYRRLRHTLIGHSLSHHSVVLYAGAGEGESVNEGVFAGHRLIVCDGCVLAEGQAFTTGLTKAVIKPEYLKAIRNNCSLQWGSAIGDVDDIIAKKSDKKHERYPFLMKRELDEYSFYRETLRIQGQGLRSRLAATGTRPILGLSGGLDSALALLVCLEAASVGNFSPEAIITVSMPGPGTSERSRLLACRLGSSTRVDFREIDISEAVALHLKMIGHDGLTHDVTYENAQARERTQILMDLANLEHGLVVGTGDLSESALGWCTYNGDHMSMYSVNASIPKTAVRYLIETAATLFGEGMSPIELSDRDQSNISAALREILSRPISPELLPPHEDDSVRQITEDVVGPYEIVDFFLWHMVFHGKKPSTVYDLATAVFSDTYDDSKIEKWLKGFIRRFFRSQFKRSASPEGVAAFPWRLSPQRAWTMPSDIIPALWLEELESHLAGY